MVPLVREARPVSYSNGHERGGNSIRNVWGNVTNPNALQIFEHFFNLGHKNGSREI